MQVCPKCGYIDPFCRKFPYSRGAEYDYARYEELAEHEPDIWALFKSMNIREKNPIKEVCVMPYVYGLWRSGYVRRRWYSIWDKQGWKAIPMERHKPHRPKEAVVTLDGFIIG